MQNDIFMTFYQELNNNGFPSALVLTLNYLWANLLWIVLLFLILISLGFIFFIFFYSEINWKILIASQIIFMILVSMLTNFSIILMIIALSLFMGVLWEWKTFEPDKKDFTTGYSLVTARLWLMSIFLCVGIFFVLYLYPQTYAQEIQNSNKELMMSFLPNMTDVKEGQKKDITELTGGFKNALTERYNYFSEDVKTTCKPMYEDMAQALDDYRNRTVQSIDKQALGMSEQDIANNFPFFSVIDQITPVLIALSGFAFFTVLNPILGIFGGIIYSLIKRNQKFNIPSNIHDMAK